MPIAQRRAGARSVWRFGVAGAGWIATLVLGGRLMLLMPLKRVEPFVVRVDNATGVVDVVPVYSGQSGVPEAVTRYLLTHYVTVCERFNFATAESDYEECGAFHTAQRNQAWYALWNPSNPASPLNAYKDGTSVRAQVTSVSFFKRANGVGDLAQVRYVKAKRSAGSANGGDDALDRDPPVRRTPIPLRTARCAAGIRSDSRSWISARSRKCCPRARPRPHWLQNLNGVTP